MPPEPGNSRVLSRSHDGALVRDVLAAAHEAAVDDARVVDVLEGEVEAEQGVEGVALEVVAEGLVDLGREQLDRHDQVLDVRPNEPRRVSEGHGVH